MNEDDIEYALRTAIDLLEEFLPDYESSSNMDEILDIYHANFD